MRQSPEIAETDVLVIGGGGAGARAALEASLAGARVILAVKGRFDSIGIRGAGATGSGTSEWGGFFVDPEAGGPFIDPSASAQNGMSLEECLEADYQNILQVGLGLTEPGLARVLVEGAIEQRHRLQQWGVEFHGRRLRHHGIPLLAALARQLHDTGAVIAEETMITDLLVADSRCVGAVGIDFSGTERVFRAGAVVLATGGDAALFERNFHPPCVTGDGHVMAYEAGATLMNMEHGQFFLTTLPVKNHLHTPWACQPAVRFTNGRGEEFLESYLPHGVSKQDVYAARALHNPWSVRDVGGFLDIAVMKEVLARRAGPLGGVFVDLTDPSLAPPGTYIGDWLNYRGVFYQEAPIEVTPARQCGHGGLRIDERCASTVAGLYAGGGEVTAGPHGADRLGGHMLSNGQVFGARAGREAAAYATGSGVPAIPGDVIDKGFSRLRSLDEASGSASVSETKRRLQRRMWEDMGVIRSEASCNRVLELVEQTTAEVLPALSVQTPFERVQAMELRNMLTLAEIESRAALMRTESRGAHYREDFPDRDDTNWGRCITVRLEDGVPAFDTDVVDPTWQDRAGDMLGMYWG